MPKKFLFIFLITLVCFIQMSFALSSTELTSYYPLNETSGLTTYDSLLNNNGVITNALINQPGKINTSYYFDGTSDYVTVDNESNFDFLTANAGTWTISAWIKPETVNADRPIITKTDSTTGLGLQLIETASGATPKNALRLILYTNASNYIQYKTPADSLTDGVWQLVTVRSNAGTISIEINGITQSLTTSGAGTFTGNNNTKPLIIGNYDAGTSLWKGYLDEIGVWHVFLSGTDINNLYNSGAGLTYPFSSSINVNFNYEIRKDLNKVILKDTSTVNRVTKTAWTWTSNGSTISTAQDYNLTATELTDYNICLHVDTNVADVNGDKCYSFNTGDWTPPITTFSSSQVPNTTDQNITLTCTDNNSGCKAINYNIDNNLTWTTKTIPTNSLNQNNYDASEYTTTSASPVLKNTYCFTRTGYTSYYVNSITNSLYTGGGSGQARSKFTLKFMDGTSEDSTTEISNSAGWDSKTYTITTKNKDVNCVEFYIWNGSGGQTTHSKDNNIKYDANISTPQSFTNFLYHGAGQHTIQYFSTDNSDNNETINFSYFPQFQTTQDQPNSRMIFTGTTIYNDYNVTSWQWTVNGTPLTGTTDRIKYYSTQANLDLNVCLTTNSTDTTCQSSKTWDTIKPTIDANITPNTYGFVTNFDLNYNMICYDNFSPIQYTIQANNGTLTTLYDSSDANATLKTGHYDINVGQKAQLIFTCTDDSNNTATYTSIYLYALQFRLINENTGTLFDLNKVVDAEAYSYDGNFIYSFKDANITSKNFFSPSTTIRFDFTYPDTDATKLSREINFDYIEDENVGICVAEYQQFYLYRFLSTSVKPVVLYNDYANCYNLASTTKFLYNTYQSNSAYTINKPYYLYTYTNGVKSLLALLDGANNTEINLDILAFNQQEYAYSVNTDVLVFAPTTDGNTIKFYFNSPNQNDSVSLNIYNGNTLLWNYTELVDTNAFEINFFYGDLNVTDTNLMRVVVTVVLDGETSTFYKYFNTKAEVYSGFLNPIVAIVFSFLIMFFGITMVSYRFALGWFGLAVSLLAIGILALAPLYDYIIFLQAIYFIIGLFIGVVGKEQNLGVQ